MAKYSPVVAAARARRPAAAAATKARFEWFITNVMAVTRMTVRKRVDIAAQYLRDRIVQNISIPVDKQVSKVTGKVIVTKRSKPGQYPRADTTLLKKTIFKDVRGRGDVVDAFVGTPLDYGLILETSKRLNRSFLLRTFNKERRNIVRIIDGPIKR